MPMENYQEIEDTSSDLHMFAFSIVVRLFSRFSNPGMDPHQEKPFLTWPPPGGRRQRVRAVKDGESCSLAEGQQARLPTL